MEPLPHVPELGDVGAGGEVLCEKGAGSREQWGTVKPGHEFNRDRSSTLRSCLSAESPSGTLCVKWRCEQIGFLLVSWLKSSLLFPASEFAPHHGITW